MKRPTPWVCAVVLDSAGEVLCEAGHLPSGPVEGGMSWVEAAEKWAGPQEGEWVIAGLYSAPVHQVRGGDHRLEVMVGLVRASPLDKGAVPIAQLPPVEQERVKRWMAGELPVD